MMIRSTALACLLFCTAIQPAFAHAHLVSAVPPIDGATAGRPTELDLVFSEGVNPAFTGVTVSGAGGDAVATGTVHHGASGNTSLVAPFAAPLKPGRYTVDWHALASDGHKTSGRYTITITP